MCHYEPWTDKRHTYIYPYVALMYQILKEKTNTMMMMDPMLREEEDLWTSQISGWANSNR